LRKAPSLATKRDYSQQGFAWRGPDAANDHIADLALSVAGDDVADFGGAHGLAASPIEMRRSARVYQFRRGSKDSAKVAE
jgi:hypothetical protein